VFSRNAHKGPLVSVKGKNGKGGLRPLPGMVNPK
jgi:hypothetical protein